MIPDEVVEQVREAADIVGIVGELVKLKRVGNSFRGPCPFHQGKDPNFSVTPKGGYHCFVCHEKGDVFTFVQKRLGLDFVEAVKYVGGKSGIEVREVRREAATGPDPREPFWEINAAAAEFFRASLQGSASGAVAARAYLESRDISDAVAERFGLGFAPGGRELRTHLQTLGFDDERQVQAGLLVVREEGGEPRVRFRHRLMFPIHDAQGRVIAFGGRVLGDGEPKYLNSPESPTFSKSATVYGIHWARQAMRRDERVLLVEGYFDCLRLMAAGIESVVAPMGTALTEQQADLLRRYTTNAFLLYDSDKAGLKATFRAGDILLHRGMKVLVVTLPDGDDPDTYVRTQGGQALERQLESAIDVFERKIQILQRGGWFSDLRRKRVALDRLLPTMRAATDPITRALYLSRASEVVGVSQDALERELRQGAGDARRTRHAGATAYQPPSGRGGPGHAPRADRGQSFAAAGRSAERELVRLLVHRRQDIEAVAERVGVDSFRDPALAQIFRHLCDAPDEPLDAIAATLDDDAIAVLNALAAEHGGLDRPAQLVEDCIARLRQREIDEELDALDQRLTLADDAEKNELMTTKNRLLREMQSLGAPRRYKAFRQYPS